jgi:UPF0755 protein
MLNWYTSDMSVRNFFKKHRGLHIYLLCCVAVLVITPSLFIGYVRLEDDGSSFDTDFPVTVNPHTKTILDDKNVEAYLLSDASPLQASAIVAFSKLSELFESFLVTLSNFAADHSLALASQVRIVTIAPGARKEEVAAGFARTLGWSTEEKKEFLNTDEGFLFPGMYAVDEHASPFEVKTALDAAFNKNIASRYGTTTEEIVPLTTTLTIASLIQKETIGTRDMRLVSGIIWNRIFAGQKLQLDATLQYAKASKLQNGKWWPGVLSKDKFIESPYNTYKHAGLPPTPIANPSVAAVVAALNPLKTDCYYYFHDENGDIHCSADYETHTALIEQFFGTDR